MPIFRRLVSPEGRIWETDDIAARLSGAVELLARRGIEPGSRVMLSRANSPEWVVDLLALIHLDASVVLVDHRAVPSQRARIRVHARVVQEISDSTGGVAAAGPVSHTVAVPDVAAWSRRQDAAISWSSGTTGSPKGIVRSGRSILDNLALSAERMGYRPDDVFLPVLPYSHQYVCRWSSAGGWAEARWSSTGPPRAWTAPLRPAWTTVSP